MPPLRAVPSEEVGKRDKTSGRHAVSMIHTVNMRAKINVLGNEKNEVNK